jgi:hypothetical protein
MKFAAVPGGKKTILCWERIIDTSEQKSQNDTGFPEKGEK